MNSIIDKAMEIAETSVRDSIDYIFEEFDSLYLAGNFEEADAQLLKPNYDELSVQMLLNVCCVMHWGRYNLINRKDLLVKIRKLLTDKRPEEVDALMSGFEEV